MAESLSTTHIVSVSGFASVVVEPDEAVVNIAVVVQEPTATTALSTTRMRAAQVRGRLTALGIAERDVRAGDVGLQQVMAYDGPSPRSIGFESRIGFTVVVRDLPRLDNVLIELVESGVSALNGVVFSSSTAAEHRDTALRDAVAEAQRKATLLASAAGRSLGRAITIDDGTVATPMPVMGVHRAAAFAMDTSAVAPGGMEIGATVRIVYELV
jgi:uncharacterized protein